MVKVRGTNTDNGMVYGVGCRCLPFGRVVTFEPNALTNLILVARVAVFGLPRKGSRPFKLEDLSKMTLTNYSCKVTANRPTPADGC